MFYASEPGWYDRERHGSSCFFRSTWVLLVICKNVTTPKMVVAVATAPITAAIVMAGGPMPMAALTWKHLQESRWLGLILTYLQYYFMLKLYQKLGKNSFPSKNRKGNKLLDVPLCCYCILYWLLRMGETLSSIIPKSQKPFPGILGGDSWGIPGECTT